LEVQLVDLNDPNDIQSKLGTGDCIFSCVGTTQKAVQNDEALYWKIDHDIPVNTATLGKAAGFHTFLLVSSVGANAKSTNFYIQLKGIVENDILTQNYTSTHIFRPSLLLGKREEDRFAERIFQKIMPPLSFLMVGALQKYKPIEADDIAKAMIVAANKQEGGKHIYEYNEIMKLAGSPEPQKHNKSSANITNSDAPHFDIDFK
jgi:nucleoside-diphosphate-sugar epimerase